jgi:Ribosomal protein S20
VEELAAVAVSALDRAVSKGVLHRNNAARRKARLMKRLQAAAPAASAAPEPDQSSKGSTSGRSARARTAGKR